MPSISPYIKLAGKVDTLLGVSDHAMELQQLQLAKTDSLCAVTSSLVEAQSATYTSIDSVSCQLQSIADYGIGYSDVTSHISLPLIIALFAFAFPFLFTVISHINSKYKSEHIAKLFSSEPTYKWFLRGAAVSAIYLAVAGTLTLCIPSGGYKVFMLAIDWIGIFVAAGYSLVIMLFVRTCIDYNDTQNLIKHIEAKYSRGVAKSQDYLKSLARKKRKNAKRKSGDKKRLKDKGFEVGESYAYYSVEESRATDYVELCKYAIRQGDVGFFQDILHKVEHLPHADEFYESQHFQFYDELVDTYLQEPSNSKIEEQLMRNWFYLFNRAEEPNQGIIYRMFGKIVAAAKKDKIGLFEQYIQNSSFGYGFINQLQIVSYVRGDNVEKQKKVNEKRLDLWLEMSEMHYLALAHLFSCGIFEPLKIILSGKNSGYGRLYPSSGIEVLKLYARCKEHQKQDGTFGQYWFIDKVIGESTDPDMLEKLTSFLLLVCSESSYRYLNLISSSRLKLIRDNERKMAGFAELWQENSGLKIMFPRITEPDFSERYGRFVQKFEEAEIVEENTENQNQLLSLIYGTVKNFFKGETNEPKEDIYQKEVPESMKEEVRTMFWNILYGNAAYITDDVTGDNEDNKSESVPMGEWSFTVYKNKLMEHEALYTNQTFHNILMIFRSRYLVMIYGSLANMEITEISMPIDEFGEFFDKLVGENGEDYFIIDSQSPMELFYERDKADGARKYYFDKSYKGAVCKSYDLNVGWYMKDIPELEPFKETVVILKKKDLPVLVNITEPAGPNVTFCEQSDKAKGIANMNMIVNPNYVLKYNKDAEIVRLHLGPIK